MKELPKNSSEWGALQARDGALWHRAIQEDDRRREGQEPNENWASPQPASVEKAVTPTPAPAPVARAKPRKPRISVAELSELATLRLKFATAGECGDGDAMLAILSEESLSNLLFKEALAKALEHEDAHGKISNAAITGVLGREIQQIRLLFQVHAVRRRALEARIEALEQKPVALEGRVAALEAKVPDVDDRLRAMASASPEVEGRIDKRLGILEKAVPDMQDRIRALDLAPAVMEKRLDSLEAKVPDMAHRVRTLEEERPELTARVKQLESDPSRLGERLSAVEAEPPKLDQRLADLERQQPPLKERVSDLEKRPDLQQRVVSLEHRPTLKYCGVWSSGREYTPGSFATYAGSLWHTELGTSDTPGKSGAWKLAVKRGRAA